MKRAIFAETILHEFAGLQLGKTTSAQGSCSQLIVELTLSWPRLMLMALFACQLQATVLRYIPFSPMGNALHHLCPCVCSLGAQIHELNASN